MIRALIVILASLALPAAAAERRVLFAVSQNAPWTIEPIVMLDPIARPEPYTFTPSKTFVLSNDHGEVLGTARALKEVSLGCVSNAAEVELSPPRHPFGAWFLAANFEPKPSSAARDATAGEQAMLLAYARRAFSQRGQSTEQLEAHLSVVDIGDGEPRFVGSILSNGAVLFLIARTRDVSPERAAPEWVVFGEREPDGPQGTEPLFGNLDLDGDGLAELITERSHKEGYDYLVYRWDGKRWRVVEGGGSGC